MGDIGLFLSLPTDSIAVRVALASVVAVVVARLLLRTGLRSPRVRAMVALLPAFAIAVVALAFASAPGLPSVWHTVEAVNGMSIPVGDTYLNVAPSAVPLLIVAYVSVVAVRLGLRTVRGRSTARRLRALAAVGETPTPRVRAVVARLAARLGIAAPDTLVVPGLRGGAAVVGVRNPLLLVDDDLLARLDRHELEGVLAHELAHMARRDNLVAAGLGVLRDLFFFVPAGSWSLRRLLREREHAADVTAAELTGRPGALAGGLLKVLESVRGTEAATCAPLLAEGTLVARVEELCDDRPTPTRLRRNAEVGATALALSGAVAVAVVVPSAIAGAERQRDALGLLYSEVESAAVPERSTVFSAFDEAGRSASATAATPTQQAPSPRATLPLDDPEALTPQSLTACEERAVACGAETPRQRVRLVPEPQVRVDSDLVGRWRLDPVVRSGDGQVGVFWLQRLHQGGGS